MTHPILPPDDPQRTLLHNELHARPPSRIRLPALMVYVAVLNEGVTRDAECLHLQRLPGQNALRINDVQSNFLQLRLAGHTLKWERHSEFTRYSIIQALPTHALPDADAPDVLSALSIDPAWLRAIPGRTVAAITLALIAGGPGSLTGTPAAAAMEPPADVPTDAPADLPALLTTARQWFGGRTVVASHIGSSSGSGGPVCAITDFALQDNGFERMLVIAPPDISPTRAGRISGRLLELETYRLMALRGLPVAKELAPMLHEGETALANITASLEDTHSSDQALLDTLIALAARVERATALHGYRFAATQAYDALVRQRIAELRETALPGTQMIGEFMQRRLSPAIATVAATAQRLASLSQRIERAGALLRTRVDIATEAQNQQLLSQLTRGQELQLRLQATVEGLSIAAISYYVVSLLLYAGKAAHAAGLPVNAEVAAGALIPLVLWAVWRTTRKIHERVHQRARQAR